MDNQRKDVFNNLHEDKNNKKPDQYNQDEPRKEKDTHEISDEDYQDLGQEAGKKLIDKLKIHDDDTNNDHILVNKDAPQRTNTARQDMEQGKNQREYEGEVEHESDPESGSHSTS